MNTALLGTDLAMVYPSAVGVPPFKYIGVVVPPTVEEPSLLATLALPSESPSASLFHDAESIVDPELAFLLHQTPLPSCVANAN